VAKPPLWHAPEARFADRSGGGLSKAAALPPHS
jgi:hypothetical protein